jgi:murein DD-endopeptidase MepM/ murein hydrolase activator NlpD
MKPFTRWKQIWIALIAATALLFLWLSPAQLTHAADLGGTVPGALYLPIIQQQPQPAGVETMVYIVRPGDTLSSIARQFGTTVAVLIELNAIQNPNLIRVGQQLLVPVPTTTPTATPTVTATATITVTPTVTVTPPVTPAATPVWTDPEGQIELFSPRPNGLYHSPIEVIGLSQTFEGAVNLRLTAEDGTVLAKRFTMGGSVDGFDFFHTYLRFTVSEQIAATLEVFEISAEDGSELHKVTAPLVLIPGQRFIDLTTPAVGAAICNPILVSGYSNTFEATVLVELRSRESAVITQTFTTGGNLGVYADFFTSITHPVTSPQPLLVAAYEESAAGFGPVDDTAVPVSLYPAGSSECP